MQNDISFCNLQNFATLKTHLLWSFFCIPWGLWHARGGCAKWRGTRKSQGNFSQPPGQAWCLGDGSDRRWKNDLLWKQWSHDVSCDSCDSCDILWFVVCLCSPWFSFDIDGMLSCFVAIALDVPGTTFQTPSDWGQTLRKRSLIALLFLDMSSHRCDWDFLDLPSGTPFEAARNKQLEPEWCNWSFKTWHIPHWYGITWSYLQILSFFYVGNQLIFTSLHLFLINSRQLSETHQKHNNFFEQTSKIYLGISVLCCWIFHVAIEFAWPWLGLGPYGWSPRPTKLDIELYGRRIDHKNHPQSLIVSLVFFTIIV